ncbi:MAG: NYN domain-containing protein [Bacteroidales bacterium]|nr:NYN domain-containing protein [Bacteroidales bacterium]
MLPGDIADSLHNLALRLTGSNTLYRIFYYDCEPLNKKFHNPITHRAVDFGKSDEYNFRRDFFDALRRKRKVALRLGTLKDNGHWLIHPDATKQLLAGHKTLEDLTENDLYMEIRQKGIDMKIGVDIASLALKRLVDTIILVAGDADFVPAAKLARREGVDFILHPMCAHIDQSLFEHIDGLSSVRPHLKNETDETEKP